MSFPGRISPGRSHQIASTLDILPTILGLVGSTPPPQLHGVDLLNQRRDHFAFYAQQTSDSMSGPYAVRYKQYKAHFFTRGNSLSDNSNYDSACHGGPRKSHSPPLMYDLNSDPGERHPMDPETSEYKDALEAILRIRDHLNKTVTWAPSEVHKGESKDVEPCCNADQGTACKPFPSCCNCEHSAETLLYPSVTLV